ncbi:TPA: opacity family porin, partial [Neisseria gonorrhoeae]
WNNNKYSVNIERVKEAHSNRKDLKTENQENGTFHAVSSLGLSAVYDFKLNDKFKPYIGARVAYGHVRHSIDSTKKTAEIVTSFYGSGVPTVYPPQEKTRSTYRESDSIRRVGLGVIAGIGFDITP